MLKMNVSNPQIAIAGRVIEGETAQVIPGAMVEIIEKPEKFHRILALKQLMGEYCDRKTTDHNGYFHFLNLPAGEYLLAASLPGSGTRYSQVTKKVQLTNSSNGKISTVMMDMVLSPTGIKGMIHDANDPKKIIANVKVQVQGSPENTISNQKGNYYLLGLEATKSGQRTVTLVISAIGYQQLSQSIVIKQGEIISNQNFSLQPQ
jgi:CarboxypepD_reg-like domain/Carboxypeptidase regulatory-like domain